jgi:PAS domain S-box-containing protein
MRFFNQLSIGRKQTLIIMATSAVALLMVCAAFITYDSVNFRSELTQHVETLAQVTADNCAAAVDFNDPNAAIETLNALRAEPEIILACAYDRDGHPLAVFKRNDVRMLVPPTARDTDRGFVNGQLLLTRPIVQRGETIGTFFIVSDMSQLSQRLWRNFTIVARIFLASLLVALLLSNRLQRIVCEPILHLAKIVRTVATDKNYSVRAHKENPDELGQLIDGFNEMLEQIQKRDSALQSARDQLERRVEERTRELANSLALFKATLQSTADGIFAVDLSGRIISYNERFAEMWNVPVALLKHGDYDAIIGHSAGLMKESRKYLERIDELRIHPAIGSIDVLELKDGRTFERVIHPEHVENDCIGCVLNFRDITRHRMAESELEKLNQELAKTARLAGMAEMATSVLHNVGNVLNSVNTSASVVMDQARNSKIHGLTKTVALLEEHRADLTAFLTQDNRGEQVLNYLKNLSQHLSTERETVIKELTELHKNIEHIKEIVAMQQSYAKMSGSEEIVSLASLLEDALRINATALGRHQVKVVREFDKVPDVLINRHKVLQIFVNLISNAKYALDLAEGERVLRLSVNGVDDRIRVSIADNGMGISAENLARIFSHGFTTRKNGHGFGLHSGMMTAQEMGGSLKVESDGVGRGATFTLELPARRNRPGPTVIKV